MFCIYDRWVYELTANDENSAFIVIRTTNGAGHNIQRNHPALILFPTEEELRRGGGYLEAQIAYQRRHEPMEVIDVVFD